MGGHGVYEWHGQCLIVASSRDVMVVPVRGASLEQGRRRKGKLAPAHDIEAVQARIFAALMDWGSRDWGDWGLAQHSSGRLRRVMPSVER